MHTQQMHKRITGVFCVMVLLLTGMIYRIYYIYASDYIAMAAQVQGRYRITVASTRGVIYDRERRPLVGGDYRYVASVLPTPQAAAVLLDRAQEEERASLLERLTDGRPFAMAVDGNNLYAQGIDLFRIPQRYGQVQYAPHLVGYLGDGDVGVAGLERAYDGLLAEAGGEIGVVYQMDAAGRVMAGNAVAVERTNEEPTGGVVLTLHRGLQLAVQEALAAGCEKGAAVVMEVATGDILAMASLPSFDQNNIAASLESEDAPFINRAVSGYDIGSVFKLAIAAGALENGISRYYEYDCPGYIDVGGQVFRCNNDAVHGVCDLERALGVSCNAYFIHLAQQVEPERMLALVNNLGFAASAELAPGIYTQAGNLPTAAELANPAAYANFSFGQGNSLASPLQVAQMVATFASEGRAVSPRLVLGTTADGLNLQEEAALYAGGRVLSARTAQTVQELMVSVVEQGSGRTARPAVGSAGGKTSSAQTGRTGEDGEEIVHAWFAGFYPAQQPKYSIVVMVEGGRSGEQVAAPIFKRIADAIAQVA